MSGELGCRHQQDHGQDWDEQQVGYARLVVDHGSYAVIVEGCGYGTELAHALGHNRSHLGVAVIDTYDNALPSVHALAAVRQCHAEAQSWAGRALPVTGHRDLVPTVGPGDALYGWAKGGMDLDGTAAEGDEELYGLSEGDSGERVEGLQTSLRHAGFGGLLGDGIDGEYGGAITRRFWPLGDTSARARRSVFA